MKEAEYDWSNTEVQKQLDIALYAVAISMLLLTAILIVTGLFMNAWIVIVAITIIGAIGLAYYIGSGVFLRKNPTTVGLSVEGIRLLFANGQHKDIPWTEIEDITILVQGSWASSRIIHKDGSFTTLWAPVKIADLVKEKLLEVRKNHLL